MAGSPTSLYAPRRLKFFAQPRSHDAEDTYVDRVLDWPGENASGYPQSQGGR